VAASSSSEISVELKSSEIDNKTKEEKIVTKDNKKGIFGGIFGIFDKKTKAPKDIKKDDKDSKININNLSPKLDSFPLEKMPSLDTIASPKKRNRSCGRY